MKSMTCKQLGGACDKVFQAETFDEIIDKSKQHGIEMFMQGDVEHLEAIRDIQALMQNPETMQRWLAEKEEVFETLSEDEAVLV